MGVEVWPCERCNGSGHVGWFRLTPCPSCRASIRKHLPTGTAGVTVTEDDEKITMTVGPVTEAEAVAALKRHGWTEQASHFGSFRYRSLVAPQRGTAALTRTGEDTRPTTPTRAAE